MGLITKRNELNEEDNNLYFEYSQSILEKQQRLNNPDLSFSEKQKIQTEIQELYMKQLSLQGILKEGGIKHE